MALQSSSMLKTISRRSLLAGAMAGAVYGQTRFGRKIRIGLAGFDGHALVHRRIVHLSLPLEVQDWEWSPRAEGKHGKLKNARAKGGRNFIPAQLMRP